MLGQSVLLSGLVRGKSGEKSPHSKNSVPSGERREKVADQVIRVFTRRVNFEFGNSPSFPFTDGEVLTISTGPIPILIKHNRKARRYILRVDQQGRARVTIPRWGSIAEGRRFAQKHSSWLEKQIQRAASVPKGRVEWRLGSQILFRGEAVTIEPALALGAGWVQFGGEVFRVEDTTDDMRPSLEIALRRFAAGELPGRVREYAAQEHLNVDRISVRNQRSRWGSCSRSGTISLNWRLVQTPNFVRDYIVLHELMHLREMNHSKRFWQHVERVCPEYETAERWLKKNGSSVL